MHSGASLNFPVHRRLLVSASQQIAPNCWSGKEHLGPCPATSRWIQEAGRAWITPKIDMSHGSGAYWRVLALEKPVSKACQPRDQRYVPMPEGLQNHSRNGNEM